MNYIAVGVAGVSAFALGGLWYSPVLFAKPWMRLSGITEAAARAASPFRIFGGALLLSLLSAAVFAMFLGPDPGLGFATAAGFAAGLCWVAASLGVNYLFEQKPFGLFLINGGYHTLQFTLYGAILGAMG